MKKKNSRCEFASERSALLLRNFRESIARQSVISLKRALQEAADAPAPRFWVSEARAMRVISMIMKGEDILESMHPEKRAMYEEIYRRVMNIRAEHPEIPLGDVVFDVVNNEAPKSYLTWGWCRKILGK